MKTNFSRQELGDISSQQIYSLERKIHRGEFRIESVGDHLPGNVLVTDLNKLATVYMNKRGCNILNHSVEELAALGSEYFQRFFVADEINSIMQGYQGLLQRMEPSDTYNFAHRVLVPGTSYYNWYFATAKLLFEPGQTNAHKILLIVNDINSTGYIAKKINHVLDESDWMKQNFKKFCLLTKREKGIITLLAEGHSSAAISDILQISKLTVNTHRRNIDEKLGTKTFAGLYRFALVFELITP